MKDHVVNFKNFTKTSIKKERYLQQKKKVPKAGTAFEKRSFKPVRQRQNKFS